MPKRPNPMRWIIAVGAVIFVGILIYSSMQQTKLQYEVCVSFHENSHCSTASGATQEEALRSAQEIDCQALANGRDETMVCAATQPSSVRRIK